MIFNTHCREDREYEFDLQHVLVVSGLFIYRSISMVVEVKLRSVSRGAVQQEQCDFLPGFACSMLLGLACCGNCNARLWVGGSAAWPFDQFDWHLCGFECTLCSTVNQGWLRAPNALVYIPGDVFEFSTVLEACGGHSIPDADWTQLPCWCFRTWPDAPALPTSHTREWAGMLARHRVQDPDPTHLAGMSEGAAAQLIMTATNESISDQERAMARYAFFNMIREHLQEPDPPQGAFRRPEARLVWVSGASGEWPPRPSH